MNRIATQLAGKIIPPLVTLLVVLLLWQAIVVGFDISAFVLPAPSRIFSEVVARPLPLLRGALFTSLAAGCGFLCSLVVGVLMAALFSQSSWVRRSLNPFAICLQTTPIIAIAPLIILWLGEGFAAVVTIAFVIGFFPILTNMTNGLLSVPRANHDLFQLYRATRWQRFRKLQYPHALPHLVTGCKTSAGLAVLGAIVGDYVAGYSQQQMGLGYLIIQYKEYNIALMFGCIMTATLLGVAFFAIVGLVGDRFVLYWVDRK